LIDKMFGTKEFIVTEAQRHDIPVVQAFYEANPLYQRLVAGEEVPPDAAEIEFNDLPPPEMAYTKRWWLVARQVHADGRPGEVIACIDCVIDLIAPGVGHIGLFLVATHLHGSGAAQRLYDALEGWMVEQGSRWLRLGVVERNLRARRFWERQGYVHLRDRHDVPAGAMRNTVHVMFKPVGGGSIHDYLALVARDRPEPSAQHATG
jgi:GNAT superfamily N-acetyltransferase